MAVHPKGEAPPMCDGRSFAPNIGYFTVSFLSDMVIGCGNTAWLEPTFIPERVVCTRRRPSLRKLPAKSEETE